MTLRDFPDHRPGVVRLVRRAFIERGLRLTKGQMKTCRDIEFIAHRGSSFLAPENTLAAFRLGWQETGTCELDVRATTDGRLAVVHDETTLRTTGLDLVVARHSLAELQVLDAGAWKGEQWRGERVPSLAEVIAAMPEEKRLLIEIKGGLELVPELARVICDSGRASALALQSFDAATCAAAKREMPQVPVYLLAFLEKQVEAANATWAKALAIIRRERLDGLGVNFSPVVESSLAEIRAVGLKLLVWTVDDVAVAKTLVAAGVDGIITNRPGWLKAQIFLEERP